MTHTGVYHLQNSVGGVKGAYAYDLGTRLSALKLWKAFVTLDLSSLSMKFA